MLLRHLNIPPPRQDPELTSLLPQHEEFLPHLGDKSFDWYQSFRTVLRSQVSGLAWYTLRFWTIIQAPNSFHRDPREGSTGYLQQLMGYFESIERFRAYRISRLRFRTRIGLFATCQSKKKSLNHIPIYFYLNTSVYDLFLSQHAMIFIALW